MKLYTLVTPDGATLCTVSDGDGPEKEPVGLAALHRQFPDADWSEDGLSTTLAGVGPVVVEVTDV